MKQLRRSMPRVAVAFISASLLIAAVASPTWAIKKCPGLFVDNNVALCIITNFATVPDTNVTMKMYSSGGTVAAECFHEAVPPKASRTCAAFTEITEVFSCEVVGENSNSRVSLSVLALPGTRNTAAAVDCR